MDRLESNAEAVEAYIECREQFGVGRNTPNVNIETWRRSESSVPYASYLERFHADPQNAHAYERIEPVLRKIETLGSLYEPVFRISEDPSALRRWKAKATEDDRYWNGRFDALCKAIAGLIERREPGVRLRVNLNPKDRSADSPVQARNRDNNDRKRWTAQDSYRLIAEEIEGIMRDEGCGTEAAVGLFQDRLKRAKRPEMSRAKCYRALNFVRTEREKSA